MDTKKNGGIIPSDICGPITQETIEKCKYHIYLLKTSNTVYKRN